jgi:hypothetical protein
MSWDFDPGSKSFWPPGLENLRVSVGIISFLDPSSNLVASQNLRNGYGSKRKKGKNRLETCLKLLPYDKNGVFLTLDSECKLY